MFAAVLCLSLTIACGNPSGRGEGAIQPVYDEATGKLQQLKYDSDKNGRVDTVSYMDGARLLRIEIDKDEDGLVERWEHYGPDRSLESVGFSRSGDGKEDARSYAGADGSIIRIDVSTGRDGRVTRVEHYDGGRLARVEEDGDRDGRMDKWETYEGDRLVMVAFDASGRGSADRRLLYAADGAAELQHDPDGDGAFVAQR